MTRKLVMLILKYALPLAVGFTGSIAAKAHAAPEVSCVTNQASE